MPLSLLARRLAQPARFRQTVGAANVDNNRFNRMEKIVARERHSGGGVMSFYNQHTIDRAAERQSVRLTPITIMYSSITEDHDHDFMNSATYLHGELPVRLAKAIACFRALPFIVGCNPTILEVHELYIR